MDWIGLDLDDDDGCSDDFAERFFFGLAGLSIFLEI